MKCKISFIFIYFVIIIELIEYILINLKKVKKYIEKVKGIFSRIFLII